MKKVIRIELEVNAIRKPFYTSSGAVKCLDCVLYDVCCALNAVHEKFPYSFNVASPFPCRQGVDTGDRKYFKFKG